LIFSKRAITKVLVWKYFFCKRKLRHQEPGIPGGFGVPGTPGKPGWLGICEPPGTPGIPGIPGAATPPSGVTACLASTGHVTVKWSGVYALPIRFPSLVSFRGESCESAVLSASFRSTSIRSILTRSSFSTSGSEMGASLGSPSSLRIWRTAVSIIFPRARSSTSTHRLAMTSLTGALPGLKPLRVTCSRISSAASFTMRSISMAPTMQSARTRVSPTTWWLNTSVGRSGTPVASGSEGTCTRFLCPRSPLRLPPRPLRLLLCGLPLPPFPLRLLPCDLPLPPCVLLRRPRPAFPRSVTNQGYHMERQLSSPLHSWMKCNRLGMLGL